MLPIRPATLVLAGVLTAPAVAPALLAGNLAVSSAVTRFLIAVPVAAIMIMVISSLTGSYRQTVALNAAEARQAEIDADADADGDAVSTDDLDLLDHDADDLIDAEALPARA